jgi:hypothetical protein
MAPHGAAIGQSRSPAGQDLPPATPELGGFAFPDGAGRQLMLLGADAHYFNDLRTFVTMEKAAPTLRAAFCSGGRRLPVAFERRQSADGRGDGRQSRYRFGQLEGLVFSVKSPAALPESSTCYLASDGFASDVQAVPVAPVPNKGQGAAARACDGELSKTLALRRSRAIEHCWPLAASQAPAGPSVVLVEFARQGNSALASLVVVDGATAVFADQEGDYTREGGNSVWRVDDEGKMDPGWFDVLLLARRGPKTLLAFAWQGAEGRLLRLLESDGDRFRELLRDAWYQAPR